MGWTCNLYEGRKNFDGETFYKVPAQEDCADGRIACG
jgi:hypothetical protein